MISIIVPVLNEESTIEETLIDLINLDGDKEIIVVDGGSTDKTVKIAKKYGKVYEGVKGRARQMNYGVEKSSGDILWFVHSDARVDRSSLDAIEKSISRGYIGGGFKLYFYDMKGFLINYIAFTSNLRRRFLKLIFGDQAIYVRKDIFSSMGGYKEMDLMEDFDFSLRLHKEGKVDKLNVRIGTSARRFREGGVLRTFFFMQKIKYLYLRGRSPEELNQMYRDVR